MKLSAKWLLPSILILSFILRSFGLNQSLWLDEAAQAIESVRPLAEQLDIKADFWPPFYHLLLHFWMIGGKSEVWLRLLSMGMGVATVYFTYLLVKTLISVKAARLTSLLLTIAPFHVWYSQEVRPYSLATLLGVVATYLLLKQKFWGYTVTSALFLYSSYLAPFLLLTHGAFIFFFDRKNWRQWVLGFVVAVIFFLPWLPKLYEQLLIGRGLQAALPGWSEAVSTPLWKSLPILFTKFSLGRISFDDKWLYAGIVTVLFLLFGYLVYRSIRTQKIISGKIIILGGLPIVIAFFTSFFLPIFAPQRLLFSLPFFYMLWAQGIVSLEKQRILKITIALILVFSSSYAVFQYNTNPRFQRENWRDAVTYVEETRSPNSLALFVFPEAFAPWQWYNRGVVRSFAVAPRLVVAKQDLEKNVSLLVSTDKIYYFHYLTELTDPQKITTSFLESSGFTEISTRDFPGVGFISIYEKALAFY